MTPVKLFILLYKLFEDTFEATQWRKVQQIQPVRLCILSSISFEATHENTQWRKVQTNENNVIMLSQGLHLKTQWRKDQGI